MVTGAPIVRELRGTYVTAMRRLEDAWRFATLAAGAEASVLFIEKARRLILR